jgi:hypothetical protein
MVFNWGSVTGDVIFLKSESTNTLKRNKFEINLSIIFDLMRHMLK